MDDKEQQGEMWIEGNAEWIADELLGLNICLVDEAPEKGIQWQQTAQVNKYRFRLRVYRDETSGRAKEFDIKTDLMFSREGGDPKLEKPSILIIYMSSFDTKSWDRRRTTVTISFEDSEILKIVAQAFSREDLSTTEEVNKEIVARLIAGMVRLALGRPK